MNTRKWIEKIVIGLGLCPFASKVYFDKRVNFDIQDVNEPKTFFASFNKEIQNIEAGLYDTSIIILKDGPHAFVDYLDLIDVLNGSLEEQSLDEVVQLASFHPKFQFAETTVDAIENHTNRSPYPLIHILKVDDVAAAIDSHPDIDSIPVNNINILKKLGGTQLEALMRD